MKHESVIKHIQFALVLSTSHVVGRARAGFKLKSLFAETDKPRVCSGNAPNISTI
ncbi:MAG: hypothetical protein ABJV04_05220 [Aliiglaciecola sp.]|uniref:hypothetical protein n=1 Tax=Aliiglaciecola sp. TaxID=1872441 RepID=UPI0032978972